MTIATPSTAHAKHRASFFTRIGGFLVAYTEASSRRDEVCKLEALSDEDLARRGITRDGIVAHVFADKLYL